MRIEFKTCSKRVVACGATGHVVLEQAGQVLRRLPHALHHLPLEQLAVQLAHFGFTLSSLVVDVEVAVVCFVLAGDPKPGSQANRLRSEGNCCRTELDA